MYPWGALLGESNLRAAAADLWFLIRTGDPFDVVDELAKDDGKREAFAAEQARRPEGFKQFVYALAMMDRAMNYRDAHGTVPPHSDRIRAPADRLRPAVFGRRSAVGC